ncbi:MAG: DUF432 domain-containing protein [Candidatus Cloacimonetes bacterium]|nr:DUF432 domain-containing protein [Candidatus Cloacimonadota bacterium]
MKYWQPVEITDKTFYNTRLGPLQILLVKELNELKISESRLTEEEMIEEDWEQISRKAEKCDPLDSSNWKRWIVPEEPLKLKFIPVMPDRPVVVRPESAIQILPGNKTRFFVSIPVWVRIATEKDETLTDIPTLIPSNTWFGEPLTGELCYAVKSKTITNFEHRKVKVYTAICPIFIENHSPSNFFFRRISIHTEFLGIYAGQKHLWTNQLDVKIEGDDQKSYIDFSESAPEIEKISGQLSAPREVPTKKLYRKMFADLPFIKG